MRPASDLPARIESARALALDILTGELRPETHRAYFEEDAVFFALMLLIREDRDWLEAAIVDTSYPEDGRALLRALIPEVHITGG